VKGIAHFVTGVAVASFFPEIVHGASQNLSFGPLLGGFAALLPDTLDFKFVRYLERRDEEIDPAKITTEAGDPDPQAIAERIASAMNRARESGEKVKVHLHTLKLGPDLWRQWSVAFEPVHNQVLVRMASAVTTGQVPYLGSEIPGLEMGRAKVDSRILCTYGAETQIDIFSGPSLAFERVGDAVEVTFLPWHRAWTHSLGMALLLGAIGALFSPVYGLVMALGVLAHIIQDQFGYMGSNLLFPLTRRRTMGLKLFRSGDARPNFLAVWIGLSVILLNLDRFSDAPVIPVLPYVFGVVVLPLLFFLGLEILALFQGSRRPATVLAAAELLDEMDEVDI
jgi:membrane-bound metal-dependent hydrolase YbcI (DUF457 family)